MYKVGNLNAEWAPIVPDLGTEITAATALDDTDISVPHSYARFHVNPGVDGIDLTIDQAIAGQWIDLTNIHPSNTADFVAGSGMELVNGSAILEPNDIGYIYWESATKARIFVSETGGGGGGGGLPIVRNITATSYTLLLGDSISVINMNHASADMTVIIPTDVAVSLPEGSTVTINNEGPGQVEIIVSNVTFAGKTNIDGDYKIRSQNEAVTLFKQDDTNKWVGWGAWETDGIGVWQSITFTNFSQKAGETTFQYRKLIENGEEWLEIVGSVLTDATWSVGVDLFTLAAGFRPNSQQTFINTYYQNALPSIIQSVGVTISAVGLVEITTNGSVASTLTFYNKIPLF